GCGFPANTKRKPRHCRGLLNAQISAFWTHDATRNRRNAYLNAAESASIKEPLWLFTACLAVRCNCANSCHARSTEHHRLSLWRTHRRSKPHVFVGAFAIHFSLRHPTFPLMT